MRPQVPADPVDPVRSDSIAAETENVITLLDDLLDALADTRAVSVAILGPCVTREDGGREVLASHSRTRPDVTEAASNLLADSTDFLSWDWPPVAWQQLASAEPSVLWRSMLSSSGLSSFVRVAMELPGQR